MHQKQWAQIEEICFKAINLEGEQRLAYVIQVCGEDIELREAVEALLDENQTKDDFLQNPIFSFGLSLINNKKNTLSVGEIVGAYKVLKQIGCGGMGEVYLAEDQRLSRNVALKVLPTDIANISLIDRFKNEARAASAISHPNVAHIYEIGESGQTLFIAMEYVEGETLRERLRNKLPTVVQALDIAWQTGAALAAAHEKGIIHRDIKPENIMIRPDNLVKVVDFGIAKLTAINSSIDSNGPQTNFDQFAPHFFRTEPGMLMGTAGYMSPEHVRGNDTDGRTDVWSLGVVLYEMIAGERLFQGETTSDVIASILRNDLPPLPPHTPAQLSRVIKKSLQKDANERYSSIGDFCCALKNPGFEKSLNESKAGNLKSAATNKIKNKHTPNNAQYHPLSDFTEQPQNDLNTKPKPVFRRVGIHYKFVALSLFGLILLFTVGAKFSLFELSWQFEPSDTFHKNQLKKLTDTGMVSDQITAISPDGKYAVYVVQEGSSRSLWLKQIETSGNRLIVQPAEVEFYSLNFSPEGNYIYYSVFANKKSKEFYQISTSGGTARKLSDDVGDGHVSLSPDGNRFVFIRGGRFLTIADIADGSNTQQTIATAPIDNVWVFPVWSPDGETIVFGSYTDQQQRLIEVALRDGSLKNVEGPFWERISGIAWLPDKSALIISGRDLQTKLSQLWMLSYPSGEFRRITNDLDNYKSVSITADGKVIISVKHERISNIYVVPNGDSTAARKITFERGTEDGLSGLTLTSDGRIIYTSNQNGTRDLWMVDPDGSNNRRLTSNLRSSTFPTVSPDDRFVAFVSDQTGVPHVWRIDLNDGSLRQLTFGTEMSLFPIFSPDGKSIFYQRSEYNRSDIWTVGINGENPLQLIKGDLSRPAVSPDGKFIACVYKETSDSADHIAVFPSMGGQPIKLFDLPKINNVHNFRWSMDGQSLIYVDNRNGFYNLWSQPLSGDQPKQITNFKSGQIFRFFESKDGREFTIAHLNESSDIIMVSNFN